MQVSCTDQVGFDSLQIFSFNQKQLQPQKSENHCLTSGIPNSCHFKSFCCLMVVLQVEWEVVFLKGGLVFKVLIFLKLWLFLE